MVTVETARKFGVIYEFNIVAPPIEAYKYRVVHIKFKWSAIKLIKFFRIPPRIRLC